MPKNYQKIFNHFVAPELPEGLFDKIMNRIRKEQRLSALRRRLIFSSLGLIASVAVFIPALKVVQRELYQSGFLQFVSLLFSDFEIIIVYWQNFVISLLESIPAMSLTIFFVAIFAFLELLKFWTKDMKIILRQNSIFTGRQLSSI